MHRRRRPARGFRLAEPGGQTESGPPAFLIPPTAQFRLEYVDAATLAENPANWRTHPAAQISALNDVIAEVGWAGALLYNERTKRLIDGHARKNLAGTVKSDRRPV